MKKINNLLILIICIIDISAIVLKFTINYNVNIMICIALSILVIIPKLLKQKINFTDTMEFIFLCFVFLAGVVGSVLKLYELVYWYDSFTHLLSGILTAYLGVIILKRIKKYDNKIFNVMFLICFTLAVAACWEIFEFTSDSLLGLDAQRVIETGVTDTMKDIICALLGSIIFILGNKLKTIDK